jgi:hypothetical protein
VVKPSHTSARIKCEEHGPFCPDCWPTCPHCPHEWDIPKIQEAAKKVLEVERSLAEQKEPEGEAHKTETHCTEDCPACLKQEHEYYKNLLKTDIKDTTGDTSRIRPAGTTSPHTDQKAGEWWKDRQYTICPDDLAAPYDIAKIVEEATRRERKRVRNCSRECINFALQNKSQNGWRDGYIAAMDEVIEDCTPQEMVETEFYPRDPK